MFLFSKTMYTASTKIEQSFTSVQSSKMSKANKDHFQELRLHSSIGLWSVGGFTVRVRVKVPLRIGYIE